MPVAFQSHTIMIILKIFTYLSLVLTCSGAKILAVFHVPSRSHHILGSALLKTLSERGHNVTMISPYPFKEKIPNYRDVFVEELLTYKGGSIAQLVMNKNKSRLAIALESLDMFEDLAEIVLSSKQVAQLKSEQFDLVILYAIWSYSLLGLADHFKAPVIGFSSIGSNMLTNEFNGNPAPPSYVAISFGKELPFFQRVKNTLLAIAMPLVNMYVRHGQRKQTRRHFPEAPSLEDMMRNVSLMFVNSHYSIESPRPFVPNTIPIGGFHVLEPKLLPGDLHSYLNDAKNGAIFFSLGSNVLIDQMDKSKLQAIMTVLGGLKEKILFKSEVDVPEAPSNVKLGKWLPQSDILAHPNVKLFISHGGLLSTTEAVCRGVPILGLPMFGDQQANIAVAVEAGYAVQLNPEDITEKTFSAALNEILTNDKYLTNVRLRSSLMRDQPIKPMDNAVFWVEHVIKYKGAAHLQNAGVNLAWYQYVLIDVFLFIFVVLFGSLAIVYFVLKKMFVGIQRLVIRAKPKFKIN